MWSQVNNIDELQEGDIVEFNSKVPDDRLFLPSTEVPFVLHYGIVVIEDGEKKMGHNTFQQCPRIEGIEKVLNGRKINRIIRTEKKSDELIRNHREVENIKYNWLTFNCEKYIEQVTGIQPGIDQRINLIILILVIILIIVAVR